MRQQMKRTLVGFALSTAAFSTAIVFASRQKLEREVISQPQYVNTVAPVKQNADSKVQHSASEKLEKIARGPCPPLFGATVAVAHDDATIHTGLQAIVAKNIDLPTLTQLSKQGDALAALVLFQKVRPCAETTRHLDSMEFEATNFGYLSARECGQLSASLLRNPIDILIPAAEAGSTAAQLLILKNAPTVASVMTILQNTSTQDAEGLRAIAEKHGIDAARSGSESAMAWLAHGYLSGAFGKKDAARAYAIAQAWALAGSAENRDRVGYLHSQLTTTELHTAKSLLNRCGIQSDSGSSIMLSPFGQVNFH